MSRKDNPSPSDYARLRTRSRSHRPKPPSTAPKAIRVHVSKDGKAVVEVLQTRFGKHFSPGAPVEEGRRSVASALAEAIAQERRKLNREEVLKIISSIAPNLYNIDLDFNIFNDDQESSNNEISSSSKIRSKPISKRMQKAVDAFRIEPPVDDKGERILWATHNLQRTQGQPDTPPAFIKRHYGPWLGKGLTRAHIGKFDPPLYGALTRFLRDPANENHPDLKNFDLPTPRELTDRRIEAVKLAAEEGRPVPLPADRKAMTALARAMERREQEARGGNKR